jgi:hypothetical protein
MKLSGYEMKATFEQGVNGLIESGLMRKKREGRRVAYEILDEQFKTKRKGEAKFFQIKSEYIFGGLWAMFPSTVIAVYVAIGAFSIPVGLEGDDLPEWLISQWSSEDWFNEESWRYELQTAVRYATLSLTEIEKNSGVSRASVTKALKILEKFNMIKSVNRHDDLGIYAGKTYYIPVLHKIDEFGTLMYGYDRAMPDSMNRKGILEMRKIALEEFNYH